MSKQNINFMMTYKLTESMFKYASKYASVEFKYRHLIKKLNFKMKNI